MSRCYHFRIDLSYQDYLLYYQGNVRGVVVRTFAGTDGPQRIAAGDLDGDGKPEIAISVRNNVAGAAYDRICTSMPFASMLAILPAPISVSCPGCIVCLEPKSPANALECPGAILSISSRVAAVISAFRKCSSMAMIFMLVRFPSGLPFSCAAAPTDNASESAITSLFCRFFMLTPPLKGTGPLRAQGRLEVMSPRPVTAWSPAEAMNPGLTAPRDS